MAHTIVRDDSEIEDLIARCVEAIEHGGSQFPGMSYEDGITYAVNWLIDKDQPHPLED